MEPDKNTSPDPEDEALKDDASSQDEPEEKDTSEATEENDTDTPSENTSDSSGSSESSDESDSPDPSESPENDEPSNTANDQAPADALSMTPDELEDHDKESGKTASEEAIEAAEKQLPLIKRIFRRVNVYFLLFLLVLAIAAVIAIVTYLNSQKPPTTPDVASQTLTTETLRQLANTDATVGNTSQTLTIQGNAIIAGETLTRGNLNVAGNLQTGGGITAPNITISGSANLGATQVNDLQVATNVAVQGNTTIRDLSVSGTSSFSGSVTAAQMTVSRLIMSGNAVLEVPNHVSFTGAAPSRSINSGVLGSGGTLSISGSDTAGTININTGNNPSAGCFTQITFQQAFPKQPHVIVSPVGSSAAQLQYYVDRNTTGFSLCSNNAAPANRTFAFDYFITF